MSTAKRVLYLSYDGMTDPLGQSQVLPYIAGLSELGYQFTLISCEKSERFEQHKSRIEAICTQYKIDWHPLPYTKRPPVLSTIADLRRMRGTCVRLQRLQPFDLVHCRGHVTATVGLFLRSVFKMPMLFDNRGFWADEKVDAGAWNLKKPLYRLIYNYFKRKEKECIEQAEEMVCLTHAGKAEMLRWKQVKTRPERITVIPCCADTELFSERNLEPKRSEFQKSLGISEETQVLAYLGSIGTWYMLEEMLDFYVEYRNAFPNTRFLMITQDEHDRIRTVATEKGIPQEAIILRGGSRQEVPALLSLAKHSLFFIRPTYSKISSSPTKQGEIMAMGIPAICNAGVGDTDTIITENKSGVLVHHFDAASYRAAIEELKGTLFDKNGIRNGAEHVFSLKTGINSYCEVYHRIFSL